MDSLKDSSEFETAIVFSLNLECDDSEIFYRLDNDWEIEVKQGHRSIVARSRLIFPVDLILSKGFELCQQALDLLSVTEKGEWKIKNSGVEHIILFKDNDKFILRQVSLVDLTMDVKASATILDKDGNSIEDPPPIPIK